MRRCLPAFAACLLAAALLPLSADAAPSKARRPAKAARTAKTPPPAPEKPAVNRAADRAKARRNRGAPRIRRVRIIRKDIFDVRIPAENKGIFRVINSLHVSTKESAIRAQLLMKEGDRYHADLAKESERALRGILRLRNVKVTPVPVDGNSVDLWVTTHETWTTEPVLSVSGVGSNLNLNAGLRERNLMGYGKNASYFYRKTDGVISRTFSYDDPAVLATPLVLSGDYQDQDKGSTRALSLAKPFRSSITPWSAAASYLDQKKEEKIRDPLGEDIARAQIDTHQIGAATAFSLGSTTKFVRRTGVSYRRLEENISVTTGTAVLSQEEGLYHVFSLTQQWTRVKFLNVTHIKQYDRDEDFQMGPSLSFSGGASRRKWTPTARDANFFETSFRQGRTFGPSHFGLFNMGGEGKYESGRWRSAEASADLEYYNHFQPRQTLAAHLGWKAIVNPDPWDQIRLGGDTGLRGYKLNQFVGNKQLLANIENRFFIVDDVLRFSSLGAVVFADAGYVWAPGKDMRLKDVKADVGAGLRLYLTRTSVGHVLRFDLAYASKRIADQERLVFTFGSSHAF